MDEDDSGGGEVGLWEGEVEIEDAAYGAVAAREWLSDDITGGCKRLILTDTSVEPPLPLQTKPSSPDS